MASPQRKTHDPRPVASPKAYARAGVDVDLGNRLKGGLGRALATTHNANVLGKIGGFGGLFRADFPGLREPVLVSSIDGVGTKLKLAFTMDRHDTIGQDLVNHCVNDIAVLGARPLFFLDYLGTGRLDPGVFKRVIAGLAKACRAAGCALVGGETAQMPGIYQEKEYDLAGCIVGVADRTKILDGSRIRPGDVILGLPGDGLHTNGYSLARNILFEQRKFALDARLPGLRRTLGEELLRVHPNYQPTVIALHEVGLLKGAAHITGGGVVDNVPRILPADCDAVIETRSWRAPRIFQLLGEMGDVPRDEMYQVFNMGIGMALVVSSEDAAAVLASPAGARARRIGRIEAGNGRTQLEG